MRDLSCRPRLLMLLCAALLVSTLTGSQAHARSDETPKTQRSLSSAQWLADLDQLTTSLRQIHPNPFHQVSEDEFEARVADLRVELPHLTDRQITLRMVVLVASIRDGHTRLSLPVNGTELGPTLSHSADPDPKIDVALHGLPIAFDLFTDGLYVVRATDRYRPLIGARVDGIGALTAEAALAKMMAITYVDNEQTLALLAPARLRLVEALVDLDVADEGEEIPVELTLPDGTNLELSLSPTTEAEEPWFSYPLSHDDRPVWLHNSEEMSRWGYSAPYWSEYLDDSNTMYVQINEISNEGSQPLAEFMATAVARANAKGADRLVLDLRKNHGGSGSWNRGIVLALLESDYVNQFGRLYVLIGRRTFSAAIMLVGLLEQWTEALFVGEPTGSALNQFGDPEKIQLENSGLTVRVSTILWHSWLAGDNRPAYPPHLSATLSGRDYFAGRDPVLEAVTKFEVPESLDGQFLDLLESDLNHAAIWALKRSTDPSKVGLETESAIELAGRKLLIQGQPELSRYAYLIGLSIFPESESLKAGLEKIPDSGS